MTAPELAYRHPKRGKAHRWDAAMMEFACGVWPRAAAWEPLDDTPVDSLDPADLCKHCWPERAK